MFIICMLILTLISPMVFAEPVKVGYLYSEVDTSCEFFIEEKNKIKGRELFDGGELLEIAIKDIDTQYFENWSKHMEDFLKGKVALLCDNSELAIYVDLNENVKGQSAVWKYLDKRDVFLAFGFGPTEFIMLKTGWPTRLIGMLKQNHTNAQRGVSEYYDQVEGVRYEFLQLEEEEIYIFDSGDINGTMMRVVRNDKEAIEIRNILRDSFSGLDYARSASSLFR